MTQRMNITEPDFSIDAHLALPADEVHLWRVDLEAVRGAEERWRELLSADELARAARFHFDRDRQRFIAARAFLRTILASYLTADARALSFSYSNKEKPSLSAPHDGSGVNFNISHSGGIALLAFTRQREVGVDVELIRSDSDLEAIARRFFSANEQTQLARFDGDEQVNAFFRCWTRKEAYIKATGDGLSLPLSQFDVSLATGDENALVATRPEASEAGRWVLREVPSGQRYAAAICVRGQDWKLKDWSKSPLA
jgi:4'-phosphopantetheinyl transferase